MRAFWNVGRSCLASRTAHAPALTPPNRPTARTFARPSAHGALKAARTLAGSRRLPHAHGRTGYRHVHPTSQHGAPGLMLCLENRPVPSDSFSTVLGITPPNRPTTSAFACLSALHDVQIRAGFRHPHPTTARQMNFIAHKPSCFFSAKLSLQGGLSRLVFIYL